MEAASRVIESDYAPRRQFIPFHARPQRHSVIVAHRRAGKTVSSINDLIARALICKLPSPRLAYIAPWFNQAKDVAWAYLKHFAYPVLAGAPNESELRVDLLNGARIRLYGADNPDRLRGIYLDHVILDEYADMAPSVWGAVVRPLLADRLGGATFIGTPKGRNAFWEMYEKAQSDPDWFHAILRASETGLVHPSELLAARRDMTAEQYAQEFECSFDAAIIGAYFGKEIADLERAGQITDVPYDPSLPVHTVWDLGIDDSTAIWFFQVAVSQIRIIDFYEAHSEGLGHYDKVIRATGYKPGDDWVPHDAKVRELGTGRTRVETLIGLGRKPRLVPDSKVMDRINAGRLVLPRCWFDRTNTKDGVEALRQFRAEYDEKKRAFVERPLHNWASHAADSFTYLALAYREIAPAPPPPKPYDFQNQIIRSLIGDPTQKHPRGTVRR